MVWMVGTCDERVVLLDDLAPWVEIKSDWVHSWSPLLAIRPPINYSPADVVEKMKKGLRFGRVKNGDKLDVYLKKDLPERLHYSHSDRIPPIIGLVHEGYMVKKNRTDDRVRGGEHGYDNEVFSMRSILIGHGPQFERGRKIPSFENVEIYNLVTSILNLAGAPNNGSDSFPQSVLLPTA